MYPRNGDRGVKPAVPDCSYGTPDILGYDSASGVYYVWEVKSAGEAYKAVSEAQWYVNRLQARGDKAVVGWTIGGPYDVGNGDKVIGPAEGAVIYGRPTNKKYQKVLSSSPMAATQQAQQIPHPTPGPAPGPYPGTAYQPGLGTVPLSTQSSSLTPLLVPIIVVGAIAGAAGPDEAVGATAVTVGVSRALFGLVA
jgi:hypothetical protein